MSSILAWIVMINLSVNVSDFLSNIISYSLNPYTSMFGNFTWGIIFGFIGAGIFVGSRSMPTVFTYLVIVGLIFTVILPMAILGIFGLLLVFIGTSALYVVFVANRE